MSLTLSHMPGKKLFFIMSVIPKFSRIINETFELEMFSLDHKGEIWFSFKV